MLDISKTALKRIKDVSSKNKGKRFFRISVSGGGCQGFSYEFKFDSKKNDDDKLLNFSEIEVLIDTTSLNYVSGSKLDFVEDMMGSYFKVSNPHATSTCGCGTSFSI